MYAMRKTAYFGPEYELKCTLKNGQLKDVSHSFFSFPVLQYLSK